MKIKFKKLKKIWGAIRRNWRVNHRLVISDESTHAHIFELLLTPRRLFVVITVSAFVLIFLTTMLIAFTPLRVYVPGYTNPNEYRMYRKLVYKVDSLENALKQNQQYLSNFYNVLNGIIPIEDSEIADKKGVVHQKEDADEVSKGVSQIEKDAERIISEIKDRGVKTNVSLNQKATLRSITLSPPTIGLITKTFSLSAKHFAIDIQNEKGTMISSIADGFVLFAGYTPKDGNMIIIQHAGNLISVYKSAETIVKKAGDKVYIGDMIATMGNTGVESRAYHLHFELWFNGVPVNPIDYISIF
jgi:murein DD-endopeptidase MepM/ murein hydrolase activator NlpD